MSYLDECDARRFRVELTKLEAQAVEARPNMGEDLAGRIEQVRTELRLAEQRITLSKERRRK